MSHATHTRDKVTGTATQCNSDCNTHCNTYCNTPGMGVPALVRQMVRQKTLISMTATLQHIATHCNTLQHTATHCNTLPRTLLHTLQRILQLTRSRGAGAREAGDAPDDAHLKDCHTLQHTATHCNTLQHTATHCHIRCIKRCNTHYNTYCNTLG